MQKLSLALLTSMTLVSSSFGGNTFVKPLIPTLDIPYQSPSYYTLALKMGTLGLGLDFSLPLNDYFSTRISLNGFKYTYDTTQDDVDYSATATLLSAGLLLDYYPIQSSDFRLSAGVYYNGNIIDADAQINKKITLGTTTYNIGEIGSLATATKLNEVAPYIGIGWGNKGKEEGWGFSLDVGAMYHGEIGIDATVKPSIALSTSTETVLKANVETERKNIEDDVRNYTFYPVIMLGLSYSF